MSRRRTKESLPKLSPRRADAHKGDFGRVLIVAGSSGMAGAATLASEGAYRSGAGLVYLACPATLVPVLSAKQTCAVVRALPDTGDGHLAARGRERVAELAETCDVVAMGPGLGLDPQTVEEVREIVTMVDKPLVLDADALNAFADHPDLLARGSAPRVLTPHPGELSRLIRRPASEIQKDRIAVAKEAASRFLGILVLKGRGTVVSDGGRAYVNATGNPGMATGGSGDVLTGMIAALLGQGLAPYDASRLAVYLHGLAGDMAARAVGAISLMATDLLAALPAAFRKHHGS
jgi:NAD(P)H-hydrate epimerase